MRWLLRGVLVVVAVIVLTPIGLVLWLRQSQPAYTGNVALPGLAAPVDIAWNEVGVPNIFAGSMRDAYRTLGWIHARDRLWQMETQRRVGQGRLSEVIGAQGLRFDREMRVLGLYRRAEASYQALDPETRADLDAYTAGVNAYLAHPAAPLPLEFQLFRVTPEPWRPADSLVWGRLMSLQLSSNYRTEALRAELVGTIPADAFKDLFPGTPMPGPATLAALRSLDWRRFAANLPPVLGPAQASNEWAVDGSLSRSGKPLLANDPHLGLSAPILWYLARIVTPEGSIAGGTVPGVPFHLLGHNDRVAWGLTTTGGDVQDLFIEDVDPADPARYRTPDGSAAFETRDEVIHVRFGDDVTIKVRETRHGPVLSDADPELAKAAGPGKVVALAFVGLDPNDVTPAALRGMARAKDWPSFQSALKLWGTPEQNCVYADVDGHIGFTAVGALPLRKRPTDDLPAPGATGEADWTGHTDFAQLPQAFDPPSHRFINANNRVAPDSFPIFIANNSVLPFRAERIAAMLDGKSGLEAADFTRMQLDTVEGEVPLLMPLLAKAKPGTETGRQALALLGAWNAAMDRERPEPLIYTAWAERLQAELLKWRLGVAAASVADDFTFDPYLIQRLADRLGAGDGGADAVSSMLGRTLDATVADLAKAYGADPAQWHWGEAHPAALRHTILGNLPVVGRWFDVGLPVSGGGQTVNRAESRTSDFVHFPDVHGPGYRAVYDLADLDHSRFVIATGQSGNPLSPHFGDLVERWRANQPVTLSGTVDEIAATGLGRQRFLPQSN